MEQNERGNNFLLAFVACFYQVYFPFVEPIESWKISTLSINPL
ncbi:hypothetical protein [Priestia filamentosa]|nr:hypothetical protein [Priestia filamentosa]